MSWPTATKTWVASRKTPSSCRRCGRSAPSTARRWWWTAHIAALPITAGSEEPKSSYHMSCRALDIYVTRVSKDALRAFVRTLPEIGGVGIYASGAIHIDTGPVRNWDWRRKSRKVGAEL